jgi:hypothetical protein
MDHAVAHRAEMQAVAAAAVRARADDEQVRVGGPFDELADHLP